MPRKNTTKVKPAPSLLKWEAFDADAENAERGKLACYPGADNVSETEHAKRAPGHVGGEEGEWLFSRNGAADGELELGFHGSETNGGSFAWVKPGDTTGEKKLRRIAALLRDNMTPAQLVGLGRRFGLPWELY